MQLNEIHNPHEHATVSLKVLLLVFSVLLLGVLGYFTWDYLNTIGTEDNSSLVVGDKASTSDESSDSTTLNCEDPEVGEKVYTSQKQGFCFNYPKDWILTDGTDVDNDILWRVSVTDKEIPNSDYPGKFSIYRYQDLAAVNTSDLTATTLEDFLTASAALDDPTYTDVDQLTVGGQNGFTAKAGPNQFASGTYYFVENEDKSIIVIAIFAETDETEIVSFLDSLKIAKSN